MGDCVRWLLLIAAPLVFGRPLQFPLAALRNSSCYAPTPPIQQAVPGAFDWRVVNSSDWLTPVTNQFLPQYCGSCWAHAAASVLSDRLSVAGHRGMILSPQPLLDCCSRCTNGGSGCHRGARPYRTVGHLIDWLAGNDYAAYQFVHTHGLTDITCAPYVATQRWCRAHMYGCEHRRLAGYVRYDGL